MWAGVGIWSGESLFHSEVVLQGRAPTGAGIWAPPWLQAHSGPPLALNQDAVRSRWRTWEQQIQVTNSPCLSCKCACAICGRACACSQTAACGEASPRLQRSVAFVSLLTSEIVTWGGRVLILRSSAWAQEDRNGSLTQQAVLSPLGK